MANPITAGFGFKMWGPVLRARLYADPTAPTINISPGDVVLEDLGGINSAKLGMGSAIYDAAIVPATPGDAQKILGVVLACFDHKMDPLQYIPVATVGDGTTAGYVLVADHPSQQMMAAADAILTVANVNLNYEITSATLAAPNTFTKISTQLINVSGAAITTTIPIRLYGQSHPDEDVYSSAYCRMVCGFNPDCHFYGAAVMI